MNHLCNFNLHRSPNTGNNQFCLGVIAMKSTALYEGYIELSFMEHWFH